MWPFASVGGKTQDLKFKGGVPRLTVGERTVIRECVTMNCATFDGGVTQVGADCLVMAYVEGRADQIPRIEYAELLARERGYTVRIFNNETDALVWLRHGMR